MCSLLWIGALVGALLLQASLVHSLSSEVRLASLPSAQRPQPTWRQCWRLSEANGGYRRIAADAGSVSQCIGDRIATVDGDFVLRISSGSSGLLDAGYDSLTKRLASNTKPTAMTTPATGKSVASVLVRAETTTATAAAPTNDSASKGAAMKMMKAEAPSTADAGCAADRVGLLIDSTNSGRDALKR